MSKLDSVSTVRRMEFSNQDIIETRDWVSPSWSLNRVTMEDDWEFPGGPVVRTPHFHCWECGWEAKITHTHTHTHTQKRKTAVRGWSVPQKKRLLGKKIRIQSTKPQAGMDEVDPHILLKSWCFLCWSPQISLHPPSNPFLRRFFPPGFCWSFLQSGFHSLPTKIHQNCSFVVDPPI